MAAREFYCGAILSGTLSKIGMADNAEILSRLYIKQNFETLLPTQLDDEVMSRLSEAFFKYTYPTLPEEYLQESTAESDFES